MPHSSIATALLLLHAGANRHWLGPNVRRLLQHFVAANIFDMCPAPLQAAREQYCTSCAYRSCFSIIQNECRARARLTYMCMHMHMCMHMCMCMCMCMHMRMFVHAHACGMVREARQ